MICLAVLYEGTLFTENGLYHKLQSNATPKFKSLRRIRHFAAKTADKTEQLMTEAEDARPPRPLPGRGLSKPDKRSKDAYGVRRNRAQAAANSEMMQALKTAEAKPDAGQSDNDNYPALIQNNYRHKKALKYRNISISGLFANYLENSCCTDLNLKRSSCDCSRRCCVSVSGALHRRSGHVIRGSPRYFIR